MPHKCTTRCNEDRPVAKRQRSPVPEVPGGAEEDSTDACPRLSRALHDRAERRPMRGLLTTRRICDWPACARDAVHDHVLDDLHREWCRAHAGPAEQGELDPAAGCPGRCRPLRRTATCARRA